MRNSNHEYIRLRNDSGESDDIPLVTIGEKPLRRICKCPPSILAEGRLQAWHPRFGPYYREDESAVSGKKEAWDKILEKSSDGNRTIEEKSADRNRTIEIYLYAMRRIEEKARASYADGALFDLKDSEFRWMMIEDGCFFLQLALFILGVSSNLLGYPDNHIIFGKRRNRDDVKRWIESMFFTGNQVPLVVLNELMKQSFFQTILKKGNLKMPSDLSKMLLYGLLVLPAMDCPDEVTTSPKVPWRGRSRESGIGEIRALWLEQQPCDLLHALHCFMLGPGGGSTSDLLIEDETGDGDLEAGVSGKGYERNFSASELKNKGIYFCKIKGAGCRGIRFKNAIFFGSLSLPTLKMDDDTEVLLRNLKYYEVSQPQGKSRYEARSYLRFLSELICSYEDVRVLASKGIIQANSPYQKEKLPGILSKLACKETTKNLRLVRIQLKDYSTIPWERFKLLAIVAFFLAVAQTVFAILAYVKPPPQRP